MEKIMDTSEKKQMRDRAYIRLHLALAEHQKGIISFEEMMARWREEKEAILQFLAKHQSSRCLPS